MSYQNAKYLQIMWHSLCFNACLMWHAMACFYAFPVISSDCENSLTVCDETSCQFDNE